MAKIGDVLDHYVGKKRTRIPEKVEEAYKLLQEKEERTEKKPKKHRIVKTIGKIALITALTWWTIRGINHFAKQDAKNKHNKDTEQGITKPKQNNDSTATLKTVITVDMLKTHISNDKLDVWTSYDGLATIVNGIEKDEVREQLITYLKKGEIIEAQEMFGMKRNSEYTSN